MRQSQFLIHCFMAEPFTRSPLELAAEAHQVYTWLERVTGDKQLAVELTRIVYEVAVRGPKPA